MEGGFLDEIFDQKPDILCLQEIKSKEIPEIEGYTAIPNPNREKSGFYGTAIYTKIEPITVRKGFGSSEFDKEGRVIRAEFENFNLFTVYAPSGNNEERLNRKFRFYEKFTNYINKSTKPAIACGDFNRISEEIDAKDIKKIKNKSGFLPEEEAWFREILESNYIDAFRKFHSEGGNFTWWPNRKKPVDFRAENKGYRFDYFLVSKSFEKNLTEL